MEKIQTYEDLLKYLVYKSREEGNPVADAYIAYLLNIQYDEQSDDFYFKDKSTSEYSSSNWMINIPDKRPILLINIPGAHDAGSKMPMYLEEMAQTQNLTILELLNAGIRKLDISPNDNIININDIITTP